jgi:ATP-binding cassette, subfamily B, bacterial MsbA
LRTGWQEATMKNFRRAGVGVSVPLNVVGVVLSALAVAVFWGGNIGALYPIVEVAFQGRTLQQWVDDEIEKATEKSHELAEEIARLEIELLDAAETDATAICRTAWRALRSRWQAEQTALSWVEWLKPAIHRCFPDDPFQTIVVIVLVLMVATAAKTASSSPITCCWNGSSNWSPSISARSCTTTRCGWT